MFASPFKVIAFIKKYKNDPRIANMLAYYGVKNITLDMLLTYDNDTDRPVFCELKKVREIEYLTGYELQVIKVGKDFYELVPVSFSVNDFFKSLDSMQKIQKEEARKAKKRCRNSKERRQRNLKRKKERKARKDASKKERQQRKQRKKKQKRKK